jgi:hypothetical protein
MHISKHFNVLPSETKILFHKTVERKIKLLFEICHITSL